MCDEQTVRDNEKFFRQRGRLSRRQFNALTAGTALSMILPRAAHAREVTEREVLVQTPDGSADCFFVHPAEGKYPGVIIWPDIRGLRPVYRLMGKRLAESGYSVLVVNPYYRSAKAPVVPEGASFQDPSIRDLLLPMARGLTAETQTTDARAFVSFLDEQVAVDTARKIGTTGYCMGGPMTLRTAAAVPGRIGAGASFHGGGLVIEGADSPHRLLPRIKAAFLIAIAQNDDERDPEAKKVLRESFDEAGLAAEIEVYQGALHGWCPPDSAVYNDAQAERAWARLLALFETALG
jgi:carboxymethylenebutenolidase